MGICFSKLASEYENNHKCLPAGKYLGVIANAEMKTPKQPADGTKKPDYLALRWDVYNEDMSKKLGCVFDNLIVPASNLTEVKLRKFMEAINVNLGDDFELEDLSRVCKNKKCYINVKVGKDQQDNDRNEIDIFNDPYTRIVMADDDFMNVPEETDIPFGEKTDEPVSDASY